MLHYDPIDVMCGSTGTKIEYKHPITRIVEVTQNADKVSEIALQKLIDESEK